MSLAKFIRSTRGGATSIVAAVVTIMTVAATTFISEHLWHVDQRNILKSASNAAAIATTQAMRKIPSDASDAQIRQELHTVAERYVKFNLEHMSPDRLNRAIATLVVTVTPDRQAGTVHVFSEADLGGHFSAESIPIMMAGNNQREMNAESRVECSTTVVEVVLAFDVTASMYSEIGGERKIIATRKAAEELLDVMYAGCADANVAVGVVPWDKTVRLDSETARQWQDQRWVDLSRYRDDASVDASDWGGCLEDREHIMGTRLARAPGLSLALPSQTQAFPAFFNPDTRRQAASIVTEAADEILLQYPSLDRDALVALLRGFGDNDWGQPLRRASHKLVFDSLSGITGVRIQQNQHLSR